MARPRRLDGFSYKGPARYFLTFCVRHRRQSFLETSIASLVIVHIRRTAAAEAFAVLAYCVMPDHVHLLVEGITRTSDLRRFVKLVKQRSGAAHALVREGPLWQKGYYEHVLRDDDDALQVARYIVANPVRAGLVVSPRDYPHVGSAIWSLDELLGSLSP